MKLLSQDFYFQETTAVAKELLGKVLRVSGDEQKMPFWARIVEVEAYLGIKDPACHTFGGKRTERTQAMYLEGGHSYVYMIYGLYNCLNFVTRTTEHPEAVLIRAVQPLEVIPEGIKKKDLLTNGPGKLCRHYEITKKHNGLELWKKHSRLSVYEDGFFVRSAERAERPRIGVDYADEAATWPLRFYIKDSLWISKK